MANQNGLFTTRDVAGSGDPDSVFFLRKGNPLVIDDLVCNNITCDEIDLNGGLLTTTTGGTILTLNGNPVGGGVATITGTIPINVTAGVNPVVSLNDSGVVPATYTVASITVDSKGLITNASSGVIPPNDDWSNFPAQTNVNMNNFVINNLATPLVATDGATKGYVDGLDANNVKLTGDQTIAGIKTFNSVPVCATLPTNNDQLANKLYVDNAIGADTLANVLVAGNSAGANQINMNNNKIINCLDPTLPQDVATKNYVDALPAETLTATLIAGNSAGANQIDMNSNKIINCADPTLPQDVATKIYVDTRPAESLTATLIAGNSAGANQIDMNSNKIVNCLNPTAPQDVATKDYVDSIAGVIPTLGQVLTAGNTASADINMNDFDISSVNDITMSGLAPTITATNILGNLTLSALGTFNALTGGQMTLASGGIMSIGGATYTTLENLRINNSVITKEPGQPDLSISDVATLNIVGSGNINFATDTLINNTTGVVKINSIAQATPALTNVLAYDPVSHEVKYQANSGGTVTGVTATTPILSSGGSAPVISHATSGVVPATYTNATVTVDAEGHVTSATNGTAPITTINGTAPIVANTVAGTTTVSHATSGVVAGSYTSANITVNAEGHITTATNGTAPATPTLSAVLTAGNTSGANHIVMDAGQNVDVTGGEVFAGTLNVNVIEPLAPGISTEIGITGSLVFPGPIEMRNNATGFGAGLKIDSIPSGTSANVLGYNTTTKQITYQPNAPSVEVVVGTDPLDSTSSVSLVSGTAHLLPTSSQLGLVKTIINRNQNAITPFIDDMTGTMTVRVARYDPGLKRMYIGGEFTSINGVVLNRIGYYDLTAQTWNPMGSGNASGSVNDIRVFGSDVYVCGNFTAMGGVASTAGIARWSTISNDWNALGTGVPSSNIRRMAIDPILRRVYIGGVFSNAGGNANADFVCYWDIILASWVAMGTGAQNEVKDIIVVGDKVFVGGIFANLSGVAQTSRFGYWSTTTNTWNGYGADQFNNSVLSIVSDGTYVYIGGTFITIGTTPMRYMARYEVATGVITPYGIPLSTGIEFLFIDSTGVLWEGGTSASFLGSPIYPTFKNNSSLTSGPLTFYDTELGQWSPVSLAGNQIINMEQIGTSELFWIVGAFATNAFGVGFNPNYGGIAIFDRKNMNVITSDSPFVYGATTRKKAIMIWEGQDLTVTNYDNSGWAVEHPPSGNSSAGAVAWAGWVEP